MIYWEIFCFFFSKNETCQYVCIHLCVFSYFHVSKKLSEPYFLHLRDVGLHDMLNRNMFFVHIKNNVIMFCALNLKLFRLVSLLKKFDLCEMFSMLCFLIFGKKCTWKRNLIPQLRQRNKKYMCAKLFDLFRFDV